MNGSCYTCVWLYVINNSMLGNVNADGIKKIKR